MAKSREIKGRMKAIANIQRITKTMQMIATARFQAAFQAATASQPYTRKIAELVGELAASCAADDEGLAHPLLRAAGPDGKRLLLVIASNRGLCGGYNANVLRVATSHLRQHADPGIDIELVGKKASSYFRFTRTAVSATHTQFGDKPAYEQVEQLAEQYMQKFVVGGYDVIAVAYMSFQTVARQTPVVTTLLPLQSPLAEESGGPAAEGSTGTVEYEFSPPPQELLAELLPVTVKTQLFQCFNEAMVSEHIARMVAMQNATDAAGKMGKELTRHFNRARQSAITTELSEIIGGATALE